MSMQSSKRLLSSLLALILLLSPALSAYAENDAAPGEEQETVEETLPVEEGEEEVIDASASEINDEQTPEEEQTPADEQTPAEEKNEEEQGDPAEDAQEKSPAKPGTVTVSSVDASAKAIVLGDSVTFTAQVVSTSDYDLYYKLYNAADDSIVAKGEMSGTALRVRPTVAGRYYLTVEAYNKDIEAWQSQATSAIVVVAEKAFNITDVKVNATKIALGSALTFEPVVTGSGDYTFNYQVFRNNVSVASSSNVSDTSYSYTPTDAGTFYCSVTVTDNLFGQTKTLKSTTITVYAPLAIDSITSSAEIAMIGEKVTFTVNASGGIGSYTYDYVLVYGGVDNDFKTGQTAKTYTMSPLLPGDYWLYVTVTDSEGNTASSFSETIPVISKMVVSAVNPDVTRTETNFPIHFEAVYEGSPTRFVWEVTRDGQLVASSGDSWTDPWFDYTPTEPGTYVAKVTAYVDSGIHYLASSAKSANVTVIAELTHHGVSLSSNFIHLGDAVTFTSVTSGGEANKEYVYQVYKVGSPDTLVKTHSSTSGSFSYTPDSVGEYYCVVGVKDAFHFSYLYQVSDNLEVVEKLTLDSITVSSDKVELGSNIKYTPVVNGGTGNYKFIYCVHDAKQQLTMYETTDKEFNYTPPLDGVYYCEVFVTDEIGPWIHAKSSKTEVYSSITAVTATLTPMNSTVGQKVTVTASTIGNAKLFCYRVYDDASNEIAEYFGGASYQYTSKKAGHYSVKVWAYDGSKWTEGTTNYFDVFEPFQYTSVILSANSASVGETVYMATDATGGVPGMDFIYCVFRGDQQLTMDHTTATNHSYTFTQPGTYRFEIYATDGTGTNWIMHSRGDFVVTSSALLAITDIAVDKFYCNVGDSINYTVTATGGATNFIYCVFRNGQQMTMDFSSSTSYSYTVPSGGNYVITVYASDGVSWVSKQASVITSVSAPDVLTITSVTPSVTNCNVGDTITFTTSVTGNVGAITYIHCVFQDSKQLTMTYSSSPSFSYVPSAPGAYHIDEYVTDSRGAWVKASSVNVTVAPVAPLAVGVSVSSTTLSIGDSVTVTASPSGGIAPYKFIYCLFKDGTQLTMDNSTATSYSYILDAAGTYRIDVYCGDDIGSWTMMQSATITVS